MSFVAILFQTGICITCVHSMWLFTFLTKLAVSTAIKFADCITNHLKCFRINHQRQEWHNQIMELSAVRCYYFKGLHYTTDWQRILIQQTFHILGLTLYGLISSWTDSLWILRRKWMFPGNHTRYICTNFNSFMDRFFSFHI